VAIFYLENRLLSFVVAPCVMQQVFEHVRRARDIIHDYGIVYLLRHITELVKLMHRAENTVDGFRRSYAFCEKRDYVTSRIAVSQIINKP